MFIINFCWETEKRKKNAILSVSLRGEGEGGGGVPPEGEWSRKCAFLLLLLLSIEKGNKRSLIYNPF